MAYPKDKYPKGSSPEHGTGGQPRKDDPTELEPRPAVPPPPGPHDNVVQLRRDIESGATREKTAVIDPAAAPLGTDDEAAGAPPSPERVGNVRSIERAPARMQAREDRRARWLAAALVVAVVLAAAALWLSFAAAGGG